MDKIAVPMISRRFWGENDASPAAVDKDQIAQQTQDLKDYLEQSGIWDRAGPHKWSIVFRAREIMLKWTGTSWVTPKSGVTHFSFDEAMAMSKLLELELAGNQRFTG